MKGDHEMSDENTAQNTTNLFDADMLEQRYTRLPAAFFSNQAPEHVGEEPILIHLNRAALGDIGLDAAAEQHPDFLNLLGGHVLPEGAAPYATVYAGHQFGHFVPQLGDGRAVTIAEGRTANKPWELQLKGAGRTPYSRFGDGRAVLRSTLREYLCSEHMHALGIPTTRGLAVIATREGVQRETIEPGAILTRYAESHIRFGHFEFFHHRGEREHVKALADFVLEHHFTDLHDAADPYAALFRRISILTAQMIAKWQAVGFVHGVMNTDNISVLGLTIDYGPYGFLDEFEPNRIINHSDSGGRYTLARQPLIGLWNLRALAVAMSSLVSTDALAESLEAYGQTFDRHLSEEMSRKIGITNMHETDEQIIAQLMSWMEKEKPDYTSFFRDLPKLLDPTLAKLSLEPEGLKGWADKWRNRLYDEEGGYEKATKTMQSTNPQFILRNWVAEKAIRAIEDEFDLSTLERIFALATNPFANPTSEDEKYLHGPPDEMKDMVLSCSA